MSEVETRFWDRTGFRVTLEQAQDIASRMGVERMGQNLDEEIEEFVTPDAPSIGELQREIKELFNSNDTDDRLFSDDNEAILGLMDFESRRKQIIKQYKADGMTLEEAKEAFKITKHQMVREHLGLPEPIEGEEVVTIELDGTEEE